ncbi:MAG: hypothetical protein ACPIOQ_69165, partial [Promethearchaeia archaeon]
MPCFSPRQRAKGQHEARAWCLSTRLHPDGWFKQLNRPDEQDFRESDRTRHFMSEQGKKKGGWKPKRADWRAGIGAEVSVAPSLVLALAVLRV